MKFRTTGQSHRVRSLIVRLAAGSRAALMSTSPANGGRNRMGDNKPNVTIGPNFGATLFRAGPLLDRRKIGLNNGCWRANIKFLN